jgi:hypothetical protein
MNYHPLSICPRELTTRPKYSIQLPCLQVFPPFLQLETLFWTVNTLCAPHVPSKPIFFPFCPQLRLLKDEYAILKNPAEVQNIYLLNYAYTLKCPLCPVNECRNYPNYPIAAPHTRIVAGTSCDLRTSKSNLIDLLQELCFTRDF